MNYDQLYLAGAWTKPAADERITVRSASTEEIVGSVPEAATADVDSAVAAARTAFDDPSGWSRWAPARRAEALERFAVALEKRGAETARRVTVQNVMPITLAHQFEAGFPRFCCAITRAWSPGPRRKRPAPACSAGGPG
jgi:acyl-CoA reductase-like NAD-dependent aldehyde dehydrogenase